MTDEQIRKLARKLAITSLRHCVSWYGHKDIGALAEKLEYILRLPGPTTKDTEE